MMTSDPKVRSYEIRIYLRDAEDDDYCWKWDADDGRSIAKCSQLLVRDRRSWRVDCSDTKEAEALATIIQEIPGKGRKVTALSTNDPDYGFPMLLRLAVVIWKYKCSIPPKVMDHARNVYARYHTETVLHTTLQQAPAVHWLFIAFVFGSTYWETVFREFSVDVFTKNDPSKDREELVFLPLEFRILINNERKKKVVLTWNYIRECCIFLAYTGNIKEITDSFMEDGLNVRKVSPEALNSVNADRLLTRLEACVRSVEIIPETAPQPSKTTEKANATDGKGGGFGAMVRWKFEQFLAQYKKTNDGQSLKSSRSSNESEELRDIFSKLENTTAIWRIDNLSTQTSFESAFGRLRDEHFQRDIVTLDDSIWLPSWDKSGPSVPARKAVPGFEHLSVNRNPRTDGLETYPHPRERETAASSSNSEIGGPASQVSEYYTTGKNVPRRPQYGG